MTFFPYRWRMKLRDLKREYPVITAVEFTFNMAISVGFLVMVTAGLFYLLTTIAPH